MTHDQINEMPAGPELDALAGAAVGWKPKYDPMSPECAVGLQVWYPQPAYRTISTDIATAMEALVSFAKNYRLERIGDCFIACIYDGSNDGNGRGSTHELAIARALAKMGATR